MDWATRIAELMWGAGLAAVPVAIVAAACCRIKSFRPATRHAMWFAVLFTLLSPVLMAGAWRPSWFRSDRVMSAVDALTPPSTVEGAAPKIAVEEAGTVERVDRPVAVNPSLLTPSFERPWANESGGEPWRPVSERMADGAPAVMELAESDVKAVERRPSLRGLERLLLTPTAKSAVVVEAGRPAKAPVPMIQTSNATREWLTQVLAARDALAAVPSIPPLVWLSGAGLLLSFWAARYVLIRRLIRRADPAPAPLVALVRRLAAVAGVKRVPEILVVDDRVSPMIWCGFRPRLIIPRALWRELDTKCQCAVIVHELCHLRRRDHRLCWVESLIGLAYWWHPVSWWARRRLRDEAEACCDAWVTTLLPGGRRAYAEALVATKSFLSVPGRSGAPGLGVSGRTRQLARRVTMVMTQRVAPRASVFGLAFAMAIAATGMFVMPGLACPPEEAKAKAEAKAGARAKYKVEAEANAGNVEFYGEAPALEAMKHAERAKVVQDRAVVADVLRSRVKVLRDKEQTLQDMEKRLRELEVRLDQLQQQGKRAPRGVINLAPQPRIGLSGTVVVPSQLPRAVGMGPGSVTIVSPDSQAFARVGPRVSVFTPQATVVAMNGETIARSYALPEGKLEALTSLMVRDDVPILVSKDDGKITIQATAQQHEIIGAFIKMIHPEGHSARDGAAGRQAELMRVESDRVRTSQKYADASRHYADALKGAAKALEVQKKDSQRQYQQLMRQFERTKEQTQKLREQHDAARNKAEEDGVEESNDPVIIELDGIDGRLEELDGLSERIDAQLEALECTIETLKEQAEEQPEVPEGAIPPEPSSEPEAAIPASPRPPAAAFSGFSTPTTPAAPAFPAGAPPAATPAPMVPAVPPAAPATVLPPVPPAPPAPIAAAR